MTIESTRSYLKEVHLTLNIDLPSDEFVNYDRYRDIIQLVNYSFNCLYIDKLQRLMPLVFGSNSSDQVMKIHTTSKYFDGLCRSLHITPEPLWNIVELVYTQHIPLDESTFVFFDELESFELFEFLQENCLF